MPACCISEFLIVFTWCLLHLSPDQTLRFFTVVTAQGMSSSTGGLGQEFCCGLPFPCHASPRTSSTSTQHLTIFKNTQSLAVPMRARHLQAPGLKQCLVFPPRVASLLLLLWDPSFASLSRANYSHSQFLQYQTLLLSSSEHFEDYDHSPWASTRGSAELGTAADSTGESNEAEATNWLLTISGEFGSGPEQILGVFCFEKIFLD